jgi:hypothetical protein
MSYHVETKKGKHDDRHWEIDMTHTGTLDKGKERHQNDTTRGVVKVSLSLGILFLVFLFLFLFSSLERLLGDLLLWNPTKVDGYVLEERDRSRRRCI